MNYPLKKTNFKWLSAQTNMETKAVITNCLYLLRLSALILYISCNLNIYLYSIMFQLFFQYFFVLKKQDFSNNLQRFFLLSRKSVDFLYLLVSAVKCVFQYYFMRKLLLFPQTF